MTSTFGWLDTDEDQRKKMLEVVELFQDDGAVDGSAWDRSGTRSRTRSSWAPRSCTHAFVTLLFIPWLLPSAR